MATQRYLVTARKYRPQRFEELVAQEHVTETLKNAIRFDRLAHAYLFSGPRGVGKTTAARILAKAINCTTPLEDRKGGAEPCRECDSCRTFEEARSLNIIEIDAASNNRVDDIRDLRETVRIPPQGGRKKVYIVDEVHMLSTAAFNALLKTLEEPPPHVLFIFATTEPHKVLPTILSRCQRFDFRRISVPEIVSRLRDICGEEEITADEASLMLIARKGDGALRDALSVFDQAVSLCGSDLRYAELAQALGVVDIDLYFEVTGFVADRSAAGMLRLVDRIVRSGYDLHEFLSGLAEHLRNLLVARAMDDTTLIEAAESTRERYADAATAFTEADLLRLLTLASDAEEAIKNSPQPRLRLESALLKMASISLAADLREAIDKIDRLEALAREGNLPSGDGGSSNEGGSPPSSSPSTLPTSGASASRGSSPSGPASDASTASDPVTYGRADSAKSFGGRDDPDSETLSAGRDDTEAAESSAGHDDANAAKLSAGRDDTNSANWSAGRDDAGPASRVAEPRDDAKPPSTAAQMIETASESTPRSRAADTAVPAGKDSEDPATGDASSPATAAPAAEHLFGKPALKRKSPPSTNAATMPEHDDVDVAVDETRNAGPLAQIWDGLVVRVTDDRIHVGSLLKHSRPESVRDGAVIVGVPDEFHQRLLGNQQDYLVRQLQPLMSIKIRSMRFIIRDDLEAPGAEETASDFDPYEYIQRKRQENPVIRAIFDQFGGELVW